MNTRIRRRTNGLYYVEAKKRFLFFSWWESVWWSAFEDDIPRGYPTLEEAKQKCDEYLSIKDEKIFPVEQGL